MEATVVVGLVVVLIVWLNVELDVDSVVITSEVVIEDVRGVIVLPGTTTSVPFPTTLAVETVLEKLEVMLVVLPAVAPFVTEYEGREDENGKVDNNGEELVSGPVPPIPYAVS